MSVWRENWWNLYQTFLKSEDYRNVAESLDSTGKILNLDGIRGSLGSLFIHAISCEMKKPVIYVSRTKDNCIAMMRNLEFHALWYRKNEDEQLGVYHFQDEDLISRDFQSLKDSEHIITR
ncbi:hypothetical protein KKB99_07645, partial [bacterium]|nr:hypothetical protein [bacterium]MBU1025865.1 hypothetical protein [bacterium]